MLQTFIGLQRQFKSRPNLVDVVEYEGKKYTRPELRDLLYANRSLKEPLCPDKPQPDYVITKDIANPFETLGITSKTKVQEFVEFHCASFPKYQAYLYTASCGSGKTLAGLYAIYALRCKTLIISTRNAVNDQWQTSIKKCFPELVINTLNEKGSDIDADIFIYTPQYLAPKEDVNIHVSLIIYDEIHSLLGDCFSKVIELPFRKVLAGSWRQLPYMIGLSATIPAKGTDDNALLCSVFGKPFKPNSIITSIPISVWDYRDSFSDEDRGTCDCRYRPPNDFQFIKLITNKLKQTPEALTSKYKGIVMTSSINSSVWAALYLRRELNVNVLLIRAATEQNYYLNKTIPPDFKFDTRVNVAFINANIDAIGTKTKYFQNALTDAVIICGCHQRLKEGFSVENCTWGIITQFVWSPETRVQMLGRIRRWSCDVALNQQRRLFYVCSHKVPSNIYNIRKRSPRLPFTEVLRQAKIEYNFEHECKLYSRENIVKIISDDAPSLSVPS